MKSPARCLLSWLSMCSLCSRLNCARPCLQDDTLIPCDFQTAGTSDDLRRQRGMSNALAYGLRADQ